MVSNKTGNCNNRFIEKTWVYFRSGEGSSLKKLCPAPHLTPPRVLRVSLPPGTVLLSPSSYSELCGPIWRGAVARWSLLHQFSPLPAYWLPLAWDLIIPQAPAQARSWLIPATRVREPEQPNYWGETNIGREGLHHPADTWLGRACELE